VAFLHATRRLRFLGCERYRTEGALPQNVNWAIKSDYLLEIVGMIPSESPAPRTVDFSPEKAAKCVGIISAW
jgi:hypothetical protein